MTDPFISIKLKLAAHTDDELLMMLKACEKEPTDLQYFIVGELCRRHFVLEQLLDRWSHTPSDVRTQMRVVLDELSGS